jgi:hypothetical protein
MLIDNISRIEDAKFSGTIKNNLSFRPFKK